MKMLADMFVLSSLFAPLLLVVTIARDALPGTASLLDVGTVWQLVFAATLILPVGALQRLQLLRRRSGEPSLME
jgi:hypothetical protein